MIHVRIKDSAPIRRSDRCTLGVPRQARYNGVVCTLRYPDRHFGMGTSYTAERRTARATTSCGS
jgi:hypothetical protein